MASSTHIHMENKNPEISKNVRTAFKPDGFDVPQAVQNSISPVVEVNRTITDRFYSGTHTANGDLTLFTTSSTKRTFITSASLSYIKDATCNIATGATLAIRVYKNGVITDIIYLPMLTTTASVDSTSLCFPPYEVDKGRVVSIASGAHTLGVFVKAGSVSFYETDF